MSEVKSRPQRKPCITCSQQKPDDGFYWYTYTTQQSKPSVRRESRCLECARQRRRDRYAKDPTKDKAASSAWKTHNSERLATYRDSHRASYNAYEAKRRAAQLQRTVAWANPNAIQSIYDQATEAGFTVDHILPLQGARVSGLHVPANLRLLSKSENSSKKNHFVVA